jgi:hypothetical protein
VPGAAQLDDLGSGEVLAQASPDGVVGALGIPDEHARVEERRLLPLAEAVGALELEELLVVRLRQPLLSAPERPLGPSVVAFDGLRHVDTTELLERVLEHALPEDQLPRAGEGPRDGGDMRPDRLGFGPWGSEPAGVLHVSAELRIFELVDVDVADPRHAPIVRQVRRRM